MFCCMPGRRRSKELELGLEVELDLAAFVELLTSEMVCVWGECHNIRERRRLQKQHAEAEEYASNPPAWQFWKWGSKASG